MTRLVCLSFIVITIATITFGYSIFSISQHHRCVQPLTLMQAESTRTGQRAASLHPCSMCSELLRVNREQSTTRLPAAADLSVLMTVSHCVLSRRLPQQMWLFVTMCMIWLWQLQYSCRFIWTFSGGQVRCYGPL